MLAPPVASMQTIRDAKSQIWRHEFIPLARLMNKCSRAQRAESHHVDQCALGPPVTK